MRAMVPLAELCPEPPRPPGPPHRSPFPPAAQLARRFNSGVSQGLALQRIFSPTPCPHVVVLGFPCTYTSTRLPSLARCVAAAYELIPGYLVGFASLENSCATRQTASRRCSVSCLPWRPLGQSCPARWPNCWLASNPRLIRISEYTISCITSECPCSPLENPKARSCTGKPVSGHPIRLPIFLCRKVTRARGASGHSPGRQAPPIAPRYAVPLVLSFL
ncbi:hypothetical protein FKP32DRAFT_313703 [Trametes sanguinea]|nr:hypothetical protein FKP32DRAFT_313703 [Trametes sanguinea]